MADPLDLPPSPPRREPIFNIPGAVLALCALLGLVHGLRTLQGPADDWRLLTELAFIPARSSLWFGSTTFAEIADRLGRSGDRELTAALRALLEPTSLEPATAITYALLHDSLFHLGTNLLWLVAFGSPVARRLGGARFFLLMLVCAVAGAVAHWLSDPLSYAPMIGASAAVSGATAAAARFVFASRIRFGELGDDVRVRRIPAEPFGRLFANPRAFAFVGIWFATNILFGSGIVPVVGEEGAIAWQAHIGGFVAGLLLFPLLDRPLRPG